MMHMPDCLEATWRLMTAPRATLSRTTYNVTALSFTPSELAAAIRKRIPGFEVEYRPDFRQDIAAAWPRSIDDAAFRRDVRWSPRHGTLRGIVDDMLTRCVTPNGSAAQAVLNVMDLYHPVLVVPVLIIIIIILG